MKLSEVTNILESLSNELHNAREKAAQKARQDATERLGRLGFKPDVVVSIEEEGFDDPSFYVVMSVSIDTGLDAVFLALALLKKDGSIHRGVNWKEVYPWHVNSDIQIVGRMVDGKAAFNP